MKRLCRNPPRDFFHRSCTETSPKTCLQRYCKKVSKKSLAETFCIEILQKHVSEILSLFRPSESATTVNTGHGTKRASYNENCSRQTYTNCLSKGNHVTEWRTWRNQNGSAKVVSQSLRNISSHLCSGRPRVRKGIELFFFGPTVTKFPKYSNSRQQFEATMRAAMRNCCLNAESDHLQIGKASNADFIFSFILLMVPREPLQSTVTQPMIARCIRHCTTLLLWICHVPEGNDVKPSGAAGAIMESKKINRNFQETCRFVNTCLYYICENLPKPPANDVKLHLLISSSTVPPTACPSTCVWV